MNKRSLLMNKADNVATVIDAVAKGEMVEVRFNGELIKTIQALDAIEHYHKIALTDIKLDSEIFKYGEIIGKATQTIQCGQHVHVNNIESVMTI